MTHTLFVTYKCNWNCSYCITDTHNQKEVSFQKILNQLVNIEDNSIIYLSGGEPGLLSYKKLETIFNIVKSKHCTLNVFTNGSIFKYKTLIKYIDYISYHCSENLDNFVEKVDIKNVTYNIVVSNTNKDNLDSFLEINKHIKFLVAGADDKDCLSKIDGIKIWMKYKNIIHEYSKEKLMCHYKFYKNNIKQNNTMQEYSFKEQYKC